MKREVSLPTSDESPALVAGILGRFGLAISSSPEFSATELRVDL